MAVPILLSLAGTAGALALPRRYYGQLTSDPFALP